MNPWLDAADLRWQCDYNGDEVGLPDIPVIGLYQWRDTEVYIYLNSETNEIVSIHESHED